MRIFETTHRHRTPQIRMINLVDILLNLLIFFIASTTFRVTTNAPSAVKLSLPEAKTAEAIGKERISHMRITVAADGAIYLNQTQIGLNALEPALRDARTKTPDLVLEFSADRTVNYGMIVSIVDAARAAGIRNLTAFTKKSVQ
jgi:biopolymer transport protein ExbD